MKTVSLMIQDHAKHDPKRNALIVSEHEYTYGDLACACRRVAAWLKALGIEKGARIVVEASPSFAYAAVCYGVHLYGAVFVPLEKGAPAVRIQEVANEVDAALVICETSVSVGGRVIDMDDVWTQTQQCPDAEVSFEPDEHDLIEILFTTGTTGKTKGVMVSALNQVTVALAGIETTDLQEDNVWLIPTPMNHAAGLRKMHMSMLKGSTVCLLDGFRNVKLYFDTARRYQVTSLYLPPAAIHLLLALASKELGALGEQLRFIYSSSAAYPENDKLKMRALLPNVHMYNCYGGSEVGVVCTSDFCMGHDAGKSNSVGKPNSYSHLSVVAENGEEIEHSSAEHYGLLAIRSNAVTLGYWKEPELTAQTIRDGVLIMSDLGYIDDDGDVILIGRSGDVINLGGLKVAPSEVEDVVATVEGVDEALLIPVTTSSAVKLKLLVVMKPGCELDAKKITDTMTKNLEAYKIPKHIVRVDEILRTFNGKIDRKQMIAKYQA